MQRRKIFNYDKEREIKNLMEIFYYDTINAMKCCRYEKK